MEEKEMTENNTLLKDNIKKPSKPHKFVYDYDIPTKDDILKRIKQIEKLKELDIEVNILDSENNKEYEEDIDKLEASIIIMQGKELPKELESKLLAKKNTKEALLQNTPKHTK